MKVVGQSGGLKEKLRRDTRRMERDDRGFSYDDDAVSVLTGRRQNC